MKKERKGGKVLRFEDFSKQGSGGKKSAKPLPSEEREAYASEEPAENPARAAARRKSGAFATRLFAGLVTLLALAYFGLQIFGYFSNPLVTASAYPYTVEEATPVFGYMVRDEEVLQAPQTGVLSLSRSEGERVGAGGKIATVYRDEAARARQDEIAALEGRLSQLSFAQEAATASEVSLKLDSQIASELLALQTDLAADKLASSEKRAGELRALILKRDYTYSGASDLDGQISEIKAQLKGLKAADAASLTPIRAARAGSYSAVADGYESLLTPESIGTLSPSALSALVPAAVSEQGIGKMIYGDAWQFAAVMDESAAKGFAPGDAASLRFAKGFEKDLEVRVSSVGKAEGGQRVVVFSGTKYLAELTLLRKQSADIVKSSVTGLRVPQNALRVLDGQSGVYCVVGMNARFKPVEVRYQGEGFCLIEAASQGTGDRLREGDKVIITAKDLYDGKVVG